VPIVRLPGNDDLPLPERATEGSAGFDLRASVAEPVTLAPGARALVPTGFALALPWGYEGQVRPRSGLALRQGLTLLNSPGTIDSDYRGEIAVVAVNLGSEPVTIRRGDRIAQLVIAAVAPASLGLAPRLPASKRGPGGFGHTGTS
jgi:dUTP pyrophosphatase